MVAFNQDILSFNLNIEPPNIACFISRTTASTKVIVTNMIQTMMVLEMSATTVKVLTTHTSMILMVMEKEMSVTPTEMEMRS